MAMALEVSPSLSLSQQSHIRTMERSIFQGMKVSPNRVCFEKTRFCTSNLPENLCSSVVTTDPIVQDFEDGTLIDLEEDRNGFVSFKFSDSNHYGCPPRFISAARLSSRRISLDSLLALSSVTEVIDCENYDSRFQIDNPSVGSSDYKSASSSGRASLNRIEKNWNRHLSQLAPAPSKYLSFPLDLQRNYKADTCEYCFLSVGGVEYLNRKNQSMDMSVCPDGLYCGCKGQISLDCLHGSLCNLITIKSDPPPVRTTHSSTWLKGAGIEVIHSLKSSTLRRPYRSTKKPKLQRKKARKVVSRDLFKSSSLQLYELVFVYPFMDSSNANLTWKSLPKEKYSEVFNVLNHIAAGVAGGGLAILLFVASRMLCMNATLDSIKLTYLIRGVGLLWLSSGLRRFGSIIKQMSDFCDKTRTQKREHLNQFKEQLKAVTFNVCLLLTLSVVTLA